MWTDARQSLWTNAFAYRGLLDAAALVAALDGDAATFDGGDGAVGDGDDTLGGDADTLGGGDGTLGDVAVALEEDEDAPDGSEDAHSERRAERYREAARRVGDAIEDRLFDAVDGDFATHLGFSGPEREENTAFAAAVHPSGWAGAYGRAEDLLDDFESFYRGASERWLPKEFLYAAALYRGGRIDAADAVLDELGAECLPGGTLAEVVTDGGDHRYAALGWSNAGFLQALHVRADAVETADGPELETVEGPSPASGAGTSLEADEGTASEADDQPVDASLED